MVLAASHTRMSRLVWSAAACLALTLTVALSAHGGEPSPDTIPDTSFEGIYEVTGTTDTGATRTLSVHVTAISAEEIRFETRVGGFDFSASGSPEWDGPNHITVPLSKSVPLLGSGSGVVVFERGADGWELDASGGGRVLATDASATGEGPRTGDLPPLSESERPSGAVGPGIDPGTAFWIIAGIAVLLATAGVVAWRMRRSPAADRTQTGVTTDDE